MGKFEIILQRQRHFTKILLVFLVLGTGPKVFAQDADQDELNIIEVELDRAAPKRQEEAAPARTEKREKAPTQENIDFAGLGKLAPFREVSVIQKKFLPKTERFEVGGGISAVTNDPFFNSLGANINFGYFFNETWGIEGRYFIMSTSEAKATQELRSNNNVTTDSIVSAKSYMGVNAVYVPIYGKMAWFNNRIVPYDMHFAVGYGSTQISQYGKDDNAGTLQLSTGQVFAMTKSWGLRWDFSWNFFSAKQISTTSSTSTTSTFNNLYLTVGASFFFPEAKYR